MGLLGIFIITMIISLIISSTLKGKFRNYSKIPLEYGLTGKQVAEKMLQENGIYNVSVVSVKGELTDHYNPLKKTVNLSPDVYHSNSVAAAAIAAHECGHAVQHANAYSWLEFRSALVPVQNASARILNIIFMLMFFGAFILPSLINFDLAIIIIIACYTIFTLFAFVTLPVEIDASRRALAWLQSTKITSNETHAKAKDALKWAAYTYIIAALGALAQLLFWIMLFLGRRD